MKTTKLLASLCTLWMCAGTVEAQMNKGFCVDIELDTPLAGELLVSERVPDSDAWFIDTLQIVDGKAVYRGRVKEPRLTTFMLHDGTGDFAGAFTLFLDNAPEIKVKGKNVREVVVTGSPATEEWKRIEREGKNIFRRYGDLAYQRSKAYEDRARCDSLSMLVGEAYEDVFRYLISIPGFADSPVMAYYVSEYFMGDTEKLEQTLGMFSPAMADNAYVCACRAELKRQKRAAVGQKAFDFCLQDLDGRDYRLSDYLGRWVLVEFSASWCGWCKKEIPYLKRLYEELGDCGQLVMLTVNLDEQRTKWEADVKREALPWPVISDLKGFKGEVTEGYNVHGIPAIFLIDPAGEIVASGLRGDEMIEFVRNCVKGTRDGAFRLNGHIDGLDGGWAYVYATGSDNHALDSCRIEHGEYTLRGSQPKARKGMVFIQTPTNEFGTMFNVYLQSGEMRVASSRKGDRYVHTFTNAPLQVELDSLLAELTREPAYADYRRLSMAVQQAYLDRGNAPDSLVDAEREAIVKALTALLDRPGRTHSEALTSIIADYSGMLTVGQVDNFCRRFDASLYDTFYLTEMRSHVARERHVAEGQPAPDFTAQDLAGQTVHLSDYRGRWVFLEFSASWCGWCKREIPYIRRAYDALKDKNVVFLTLMMDDRKDLWQGEVEKHDITWTTLSDLKGIRASEIAREYNVSGIPASFVISPEGRIVDRDLRGDEVLSKLESYAEQ